ncbi:hypothetical protein SAQ01S_26530 [Sphingomonas aquatilis NBRC 16722]|nr:hypothetical protein SAQ01S_26530 [Sphingomonas aquatilis NBRC 16722]
MGDNCLDAPAKARCPLFRVRTAFAVAELALDRGSFAIIGCFHIAPFRCQSSRGKMGPGSACPRVPIKLLRATSPGLQVQSRAIDP